MGDDVLSVLDPTEREWVVEFRRRLCELLGPRLRDLRLYGSKARGTSHDESDIDLLVLIENLDWDAREAVIHLAVSISPWLAPNIYDYERYHLPISRASGFYKEMRRESVRLLQ